MGGIKCKTQEERDQRRKECNMRYYHKNKAKPDYIAKRTIYHRKASLAYYYRNKLKVIEKNNEYNKTAYKDQYNFNHRKYYYQKKLNDINADVPDLIDIPRGKCINETERLERKQNAQTRFRLKKKLEYWKKKLDRNDIILIKNPSLVS